METGIESKADRVPSRGRLGRGILRGCAFAMAAAVLILGAGFILVWVILRRAPESYPLSSRPIPPATSETNLGGGLDGFESPYLGHTGSWNGTGGAIFGGSKIPDLEKERAMGLRWTFMPVYWRAMEPDGPVDLSGDPPPAWQALDAFVIAAKERNLNVLMQAPVVGGNAGGPPDWAGRREPDKSAPADMDALAAFAGKLAERYRPGGKLAQREGWGTRYGVRAWEIDNEPESYRTHWKGQAADYAEFATRAAARIKAADSNAVIVLPGMSAGKHGLQWLKEALDAKTMAGSPAFRAQAKPFSIGPVADVVSFHNYEGLDSAFSGGPRTITQVFDDVRAVFERWEQRPPGFTYARKQDYWHTEGNFDFLGILSSERRAAWRFQFFTRAFAAGIRKVCVMDASPAEQTAVRAYVTTLPKPFPMLAASNEVVVVEGKVSVFRHPDSPEPNAGQVWVIWALADTGPAIVEVPVQREHVEVVSVDGQSSTVAAAAGRVRIELAGDSKMAAALLVVDRPGKPGD
jgi:Cellulase (glycosyl hydrolase family 5)